jgi:hypothetical protein
LRGLQIQITDREVERLWDYYRILLKGLNQQDRTELRAVAQIYGGLIWAVDGLEPESGQPQLWVVREVLSAKVIHAEWLPQVDEAHLTDFLRPVKALRFKTLATVSDQQPALVKALKATWHKPHQACQSHFLRDAAKPLVERDRSQMVEMKAKIRGIRALERQVEAAATGDRCAEIVGIYLVALRQGLRLRSRAPLHLGGLLLYKLLDDLVRSLQRCLKKVGTSGWPNYWTWFTPYAINTDNPCTSSLKVNGG